VRANIVVHKSTILVHTMPLSEDRTLAQITTKAKDHMKDIVECLKAQGLPISGTYWLSNLILLQPIPNGNKPAAEPGEEQEGKQ
jgi:hypothetical protein